MREAFARQKILTFSFNKKNICIFQILTFEILAKRSLTMWLIMNIWTLAVLQNLHQEAV